MTKAKAKVKKTAFELFPLRVVIADNGDMDPTSTEFMAWRRVTPDGFSFQVLYHPTAHLQLAYHCTRLEQGHRFVIYLTGDVWDAPTSHDGYINWDDDKGVPDPTEQNAIIKFLLNQVELND